MLKKIKSSSYFGNLIALFIPIMIITVLILGLLLDRSLQQFHMNCSVGIDNAGNAMNLLVADMKLNANSMLDSADFSTNKIVTKYGSFLAISRTLTHYVSCTDIVSNAFYVNSDTQTVYTTAKPYPFEAFSLFNEGYGITQDDYVQFFLRDESSFWIPAQKMAEDQPPVITYVVTYTLHADTPEYALVMHVDTEKLTNLLANYLSSPNSMIMMLDSNKNELFTVGNRTNDRLAEAFSSFGYGNPLPRSMSDGKQTYEIYVNESKENAISYVLIVPRSDVWSAIHVNQIFVIPLLIVLALAIIFIWSVSQYANSAKHQMPGRIALKMYNGCYVDKKELLDDLRQMGIIKQQPWFQAFILKIADGGHARISSCLSAVKGMVKGLEGQQILVFFNTTEENLFFVLNGSQDALALGLERMARFKDELAQRVQSSVAMGVGTPVEIEQIARSVNEARIALNNRFVRGENSFICFRALGSPTANIAYPSDKIKQYYNALLTRQKYLVELSLDNLMSTISDCDNLFFATCIMYDIVNTTFKASDELRCPKHVFEKISLQDVKDFASIQEIKRVLDNLIQNVILPIHEEDCASEDMPNDRAILFQQIKQYIQQHFTEADFSVKAIAAEFDMSVSNFSHFFKKQQNMNVSDYILQLRIEKSKELIRTTDQTFQEISLACGYANISTFLRQFKQSEQMTPSQYRSITRKATAQG